MSLKITTILIFWCAFSLTAQAQVINAGVSGNTTSNLLNRLEHDVLEQQPDVVIIMVGTNDMLNSKKMISYSTYEENLSTLIKAIKNRSTKVLLVAPPTVDSTYLFERHDRKLFRELPNVKLDTVRTVMMRLANEFNVDFVDVYQEFVNLDLPQHNEDLVIRNEKNSARKDGVHLTALGYKMLAQSIFTALESNDLLQKNQKIICFGDSLTFGAGFKKGGSVIGESYPAVLQKLILEHFELKK
ncbi:SGNH/GDSL hydrolase family protein [Cellulophaga baltica]|uniref:SGNH/GDSL hydrolase family protein n=1 Tax=Cellulophaga baltica TaxID=76594 RepID=UPI0024944EEB|nr:GDSL-type esterase/lipase family protein [Cellulophaga baltica]